MIVTSFTSASFRNLSSFSFSPHEQVNLILGENGQGKTNLLEGIWLLTGARSFRQAKQQEMVAFGSSSARLGCSVQNQKREITLEMTLGQEKKQAVNGVKIPKKADFTGNLTCVAFSPTHLSLVSDGPEKRRAFLDAALCQSGRRYLDHLSMYQGYLKQKNALLRKEMDKNMLNELLEGYDREIAKHASVLFAIRRGYIDQLSKLAFEMYESLSGKKEALSCQYLCGAKEESFEGFLEELRKGREKDIFYKTSLIGPHKDDLSLLLDDKAAKVYGSQGQRRSVVLALKLAEAALMEEKTGESPVILLDDVLSELDNKRQDHLLNHITGRQIFVTACEEQKSGVLAGGKKFFMQNGVLTELL